MKKVTLHANSENFGMTDYDFDFSFSGEQEDETRLLSSVGYNVNRGVIHGASLLSAKNLGVNLVIRLKNNFSILHDEILFWAKQMVSMIPVGANFDFVSHPPSSGKRPDSQHLATFLAKEISRIAGIDYCNCIRNLTPRGHKASLNEKLSESKNYKFEGIQGKYLMVDDVLFTRRTATATVLAMDGCFCFWLFLYGN